MCFDYDEEHGLSCPNTDRICRGDEDKVTTKERECYRLTTIPLQ